MIEEIPIYLKPIEDKADLTNARLEKLRGVIYQRAGDADANNILELRTWKAVVESIEN